MILRLKCPGCKKDSYSASVEMFKPCPYCGILFSGKYGMEKRREYRTTKEIPFFFSHNIQTYPAKTYDISQSGICVKMDGEPCFAIGDVVDLNIKDSSARAQVVWIDNKKDIPITKSGLKILEGKFDPSKF